MVELNRMENSRPAVAMPVDIQTAEYWVGIYVKDFGELPSETYEKTHRAKLSFNPDSITELQAILRIRPKFLVRVGATREQIEWLKRRVV